MSLDFHLGIKLIDVFDSIIDVVAPIELSDLPWDF